MQKDEIKSGMSFEDRKGNQGRFLMWDNDIILCYFRSTWTFLSYFSEDLIYSGSSGNSGLDIMKVYYIQDRHKMLNKEITTDLLWERFEPKLIRIKGKDFSEDTIAEALKSHCDW